MLAAALVVALAGCAGGDDGTAPGREPTADRRATAPSQPAPARSDRDCIELWNENETLGTAGQKAPADFLVEVSEDGDGRLFVLFDRGECLVYGGVPGNPREAYLFVARRGRAPFGHPGRVGIPKNMSLNYNTRATPEGRIEPK